MLDKKKLEDIFEYLNDRLSENYINLILNIYGGSCMLLTSDSRPLTKDIDCIFNSTNDEILKTILNQISQVFDLEEDWMNSEISEPLTYLKKEDLKTLMFYSNIEIIIPSDKQMLAMKLLSSRPEPSKDFVDTFILCKRLNIKTRKELMDIFSDFIDVKYIGERQLMFIKYLLEDLCL